MERNSAFLLLRIRLIVGFLGERSQYAWWPTAFFEQSGRTFLEPVFSRTALVAQYHGVLEAAQRAHDEHLSLGCFHLFRLQEEQEQDLHRILCEGVDILGDCGIGQGKVSSLALLEQFAGTAGGGAVGPISVGSIEDLEQPSVVKAFAGAYLSGFNKDTPVYPYLVTSL
jgi:hypothetical protein